MKKVQTIKPKILEPVKRKKVAAYTRVSVQTELMDHSLSTQISYFNQLIQNNLEWEFVEVYSDHGITGTSIKQREGFQRMIADAKAGKIDIILTKSITRFARNTVDLLNTVRQLKEIGVEVRFEKENINSLSGDGELMLSILASFAQEESLSISENVKWGTVKRFQQGIPNGKFHIYGYKWEGDNLVINEAEAKIVKRIYRDYLDGKTPGQIARELNAEGIPTKHNKLWITAGVRSILTNIHYTGCLLLQKEYQENPISGKTRKNNGELPQYRVDDHHPIIIPEKMFNEAQKEKEARGFERYGWYNPNPKHVAYKKIFICGCCGKKAKVYDTNGKTSRSLTYIQCPTYSRKKEKGGKCESSSLNALAFKHLFLEMTNSEIYSEKRMLETIEKAELLPDQKVRFTLHDGTIKELSYSHLVGRARRLPDVIEEV